MRRLWAALASLALAGCASGAAPDSNAEVYAAWAGHRSHIEVTAQGIIARNLGTRRGPSGTHTGFLLHLSGPAGRGLTVRVEDNIDMTGPVPITEGSPATVRGEYIYDPRGGLIHWTHRDPRMRHEPGFIETQGRKFQ